MQEAKIQQQAAEKEKILKTTQRQPAPGEELESRIGGGGKAVSSKAKSIKAAARSGATSVALTRSSKVRLFSYYCFKTQNEYPLFTFSADRKRNRRSSSFHEQNRRNNNSSSSRSNLFPELSHFGDRG